MNSAEAKRILLAFRPGSGDAQDAEVKDALDQLERDPELRRWFESHCAFQTKIRAAFAGVPPPADLRDRILAGAKTIRHPAWSRRGALLAAAAALVFLIGLAAFWQQSAPADSFETFRSRMVRTVLREYRMDITTEDKTRIQQFLASNNAPSADPLPEGLTQLPAAGAGLLSWQGEPVSMVCLDSGPQGLLFVFIVDASDMRNAPQELEFARVNKLTTASWTRERKTYVVACAVQEDALRALLESSRAP